MKSATEAQFGTDQSEPEVIPAESTASQSVGSRSPPGVSAGDVSPCTAPRDGDVTGDGHPGDGRASRRHDDTADDVMGQGQVTSKSFSSDKGCNGQGSNDQGSNRQASTSHHAPSVVTVDDPGVSGHDEVTSALFVCSLRSPPEDPHREGPASADPPGNSEACGHFSESV